MILPAPKTMLIIDFFCALSAGIVYFIFFDFLHHNLNIPYWIVMLQLIANNAYGVCGILIFLIGFKGLFMFRFLIIMNFIYAGLCIFLGFYLFFHSGSSGTWLLFLEAIFIGVLAMAGKTQSEQ